MKVVTVRDFRDRATELLRSEELALITRDGLPAGFFVPWGTPDVPDEVCKAGFSRLVGQIRQEREALGIDEEGVLDDFATRRRRHSVHDAERMKSTTASRSGT